MTRNHMYLQWEGLSEEREVSCRMGAQCVAVGGYCREIAPLQPALHQIIIAPRPLSLYSLYSLYSASAAPLQRLDSAVELYSSTASTLYNPLSTVRGSKTAQISPPRVVYVVREPRPDASVALRSERPEVSKCSTNALQHFGLNEVVFETKLRAT
eukprot:6253734-Prymnesium_polylepis.1